MLYSNNYVHMSYIARSAVDTTAVHKHHVIFRYEVQLSQNRPMLVCDKSNTQVAIRTERRIVFLVCEMPRSLKLLDNL